MIDISKINEELCDLDEKIKKLKQAIKSGICGCYDEWELNHLINRKIELMKELKFIENQNLIEKYGLPW